VCWSHIERDVRRHSEGLAEQNIFDERDHELTRRVLHARRAFKHEHHDRDHLQAEIAPIHTELQKLLEDASPKSKRTRRHRRSANNLPKVRPSLWTFPTFEGDEPTNNPAERAPPGPVIHPKLTHGTSSTRGERLAEPAQSAAATRRLQGRPLLAYQRDLLVTHNRGDPSPALT
jgi:Transposase IS66 family